MRKPLCVAFLWHMHQPDYRTAETGETYLPWTRFHAIKDYYDMGALVEEAGATRVTINIVPSLADQLKLYGSGEINEVQSRLTLREATSLDDREKGFLLRTFFQLSPSHMLFPYPRYRELWDRRGSADEKGEYPTALRLYSDKDYRDLQLWYNLTWCGRELKKDPRISALFAKARHFTEEDKKELLEIQYSFIGRILPYYRRLSDARTIEFSLSPYYHPILPLLCDLRSAKESLPNVALPPEPFTFTQDAREHIARAVSAYREIFGRAPRGMWPSEGSISDASLHLAREAGLLWLASDESVLWNSLHRDGRVSGPLTAPQKYSAYRWGAGDSGPCLFFRDHALSDLLGFSYYSWRAADAVADFMERLHKIHRSLPNDGRHYVVPVILDGENAWEHYPDNGAPFLKLLYTRLSESREIRTVTFSEFLDLESHREPLSSVVSGSWIYGNLATWIGHEEKNRGWELLTAARRLLASSQLKNLDAGRLESAFHEIMVAEGSDWFWWYGDDHQTENAAEFDELFRGHLKNVYRILGESVPVELDRPIKKIQARVKHRNPVHTLSPQIDGLVSDYYEWISAGFAVPGHGDSMHRTESCIEKVCFGFDDRFFYVRIDMLPTKMAEFPAGGVIQLQFVSPAECRLVLQRIHGAWSCRTVEWPDRIGGPLFAARKIIEIGVPLQAIGVENSAEVTFFISVFDGGREVERFPSSGFIPVETDPWGLDQQEWIV